MRHGNRGKGRPRGAVGRLTRSVREAFEQVFTLLQDGGPASLEKYARANPGAFYTLAARLIPAALNVGLTSGALAERLVEARKITKRPGEEL